MSGAKTKNRRKGQAVWGGKLVLSILIFLSPGFGQTQNQPPSSQSSKTEPEFFCGLRHPEAVTVDVEVTDKRGRFVSGLNYRDFIVYEDNLKQPIDFFTEEEVLISGRTVIKYNIGYVSRNEERDGKYRSIRVETREGKSRKPKVFSSPNGYFAKMLDR